MKFKLRRYFLYYAARVLAFLICLLPLKVSLWIAGMAGECAFLILGRYRRITIENLTSVFGKEKTEKEIRDIARKVFENLAKGGVELVSFSKIKKDDIPRLVSLQNHHILDAAFEKGKGIVILTAHFGSWELLAVRLKKDYPGCTIAKRLYFEKYDRYLNSLRALHDVEVIYRDESPRKVLKALKNNEIVGIVADQDIDSVEGVFVNFFGRPAYTPSGPAALAKASGASLIPAFIVRNNGHHTLIVEEPIVLDDTGDKEADLIANTQKWSNVIESYIRRYPEQWVWMHRRWKTQPAQKKEMA